ncbi:MAG TPA: hypothetical protein VMT76_06970 [Puia sp.]|nr:hypothetical protein [Puia sp.]
MTTHIILEELYDPQVAIIRPHILSGKFLVIQISRDELQDIQQLASRHPKLSEQDCSAYYYAQQKNAILLSGDKNLKSVAEAEGITVRGIFWVIDELVRTAVVSKSDARTFLSSLRTHNKWLPGNEFERRVREWGE